MNGLARAAQPLFLVLVLATVAGGVIALLRDPPDCLASSASGREAAQGALVRTGTGSLAQVVHEFVAAQPGPDSQAYEVPQPDEVRMLRDAFGLVATGRHRQAAELVAPLDYEVVRCNDQRSGIGYSLLAERRRPDGSWPHGWGLYVHSDPPVPYAAGMPPLVIEVPHPTADLESAAVGVELFQAAQARYLLVAGAHRYAVSDGAADVAHRADSVFEGVHREVLVPDAVVVQPHGFAEVAHPELGEVVVSAGTSPPTSLATRVAEALDVVAETCLYDGTTCAALAGTRNVQGQSARADGAGFIHLELAFGIRNNPGRREEIARQVASVLGP